MGQLASLGVGGGPTGPAFAPSDIAGLVLWLRADDIAQADNTSVASWTDASGSGNNATSVNQPTYQTAELNGHSVVRYDGTDDFMTVAGITNSDATRTFFFVCKINTFVSADAVWGWSSSAAVQMTTTAIRYNNNQVGGAVAFGSPGTAVHHIYTLRFNSTSSADLYYDAGSATNFDPDDGYQSGAAALAIGARQSGGNVPGAFDLAEMIVYNSALSDGDRGSVLGYLQSRFAL